MEEIRTFYIRSLIINWDQTAINYIPLSSWTMEKRGSNRVEIVALDDKHKIIAVFAGTLGYFLPPHPYLSEHHTMMSSKCRISKRLAWSNEEATMQYIDKILLPYVK